MFQMVRIEKLLNLLNNLILTTIDDNYNQQSKFPICANLFTCLARQSGTSSDPITTPMWWNTVKVSQPYLVVWLQEANPTSIFEKNWILNN